MSTQQHPEIERLRALAIRALDDERYADAERYATEALRIQRAEREAQDRVAAQSGIGDSRFDLEEAPEPYEPNPYDGTYSED